MLAGISSSPGRNDSLLASSLFLAAKDTVRALAWHPTGVDTTSPAWEIVEARRLLLRHATGDEVSSSLLAIWRRFSTSQMGRRCALAALRGGNASAVDLVADDLPRWPAPERAQAGLAIAETKAAAGAIEGAETALRAVLAAGVQPFAAAAAEALARHRGLTGMDPRTLEDVAGALLAGGRAATALALLPDSGTSDALTLLRARALVAAGRATQGITSLTRLARGEGAVAADALWFLAGHEKRVDQDSLAAEHYRSLVRRFPSNSRAPDAAWEAAWAFERTGHLARAGVLYRDILRMWPHGPHSDNSRFRWGLVAWRAGDEGGAVERWMTTWPHLRDARAKAAVAYWLGKGLLLHGRIEEARRWWERARDEAAESFYGQRAQQRLAATATETRAPATGAVPTPDLADWLAGWHRDAPRGQSRALIRAARLYDIGFAVEAKEELRAASDAAGRSPSGVVEVIRFAQMVDAPDVVAAAATRLKGLYESCGRGLAPPWLERMTMPVPFRSLLVPVARRQGLDPCLVSALIRKESFYERTAVSRAGAAGLMQLMPQTAAATARRAVGIDPTRRTEVATNLMLGCLHLREVLDLHGSLIRALAAYNAGPDPLRRWVRTLPTHDDELWVECITYSETRNYVKTVLAFTWRYRDLWPELRHGEPFAALRVEEP